MITKLFTAKQYRQVKALVKKECCNYDNGYCILLDDGWPCVCPQIISLHPICKWFKIAVLPLDKDLYIPIMEPPNTRKCVICGKPFIRKGNKAKYCDKCRVIVRHKKNAEYERNRRLRRGQIGR